MDRNTEQELMRLAHGEQPPAQRAALEARLAREPELRAALARLEAGWRGLDLPEPEPAPSGFAAAVAARALAEWRDRSATANGLAGFPGPTPAPPALRLAAAAALVAGVALGVAVGGDPVGRLDEPEESGILAGVPTLAESYWLAAADPSALERRPGRAESPDAGERKVPR